MAASVNENRMAFPLLLSPSVHKNQIGFNVTHWPKPISVDAPLSASKLVPIFKGTPSGLCSTIFSSGESNSANIVWTLFICVAGSHWCVLWTQRQIEQVSCLWEDRLVRELCELELIMTATSFPGTIFMQSSCSHNFYQ